MVQGEAKADFVSVIRNGKSLGDGDKPGLVGGAVLNIFLQDVQTVFLSGLPGGNIGKAPGDENIPALLFSEKRFPKRTGNAG